MQQRQIHGERAIRLQIMARPSLVDLLDQYAEREGLSRSAAIARFVAAGIEREQQAESAA